MDFLPYNRTLLRCHPMFSFLTDTSNITNETPFVSRKTVKYKCPMCNGECMAKCMDLCRQTLLCEKHPKNRGRSRRVYNGSIPYNVSFMIRASLLRQISIETIRNLIKSTDTKLDLLVVDGYIGEMKTYDDVVLADNCFWGNGSDSRINKERYIRCCKKRKVDIFTNKITQVLFFYVKLYVSCSDSYRFVQL